VDVDVDLIGWVGVGLGGTYGCRCGILYTPIIWKLPQCDLQYRHKRRPNGMPKTQSWDMRSGSELSAILNWHVGR